MQVSSRWSIACQKSRLSEVKLNDIARELSMFVVLTPRRKGTKGKQKLRKTHAENEKWNSFGSNLAYLPFDNNMVFLSTSNPLLFDGAMTLGWCCVGGLFIFSLNLALRLFALLITTQVLRGGGSMSLS